MNTNNTVFITCIYDVVNDATVDLSTPELYAPEALASARKVALQNQFSFEAGLNLDAIAGKAANQPWVRELLTDIRKHYLKWVEGKDMNEVKGFWKKKTGHDYFLEKARNDIRTTSNTGS